MAWDQFSGLEAGFQGSLPRSYSFQIRSIPRFLVEQSIIFCICNQFLEYFDNLHSFRDYFQTYQVIFGFFVRRGKTLNLSLISSNISRPKALIKTFRFLALVVNLAYLGERNGHTNPHRLGDRAGRCTDWLTARLGLWSVAIGSRSSSSPCRPY